MALVLTEPFNNLSAWGTTAPAPNIVTGRTGTAAQFVQFSTGGAITYSIPGGSQTDTLTIGFAFNPGGVGGSEYSLVEFYADANATQHNRLRVNSTGQLIFYRASSALFTSAAGVIVASTWQYIELQVKLSDTVGTYTIKVNGTQITTATAQDTKNAGTATVYDTVRLDAPFPPQTGLFDDLYIRNDTTFQGDPTVGPVVTGTGAISFAGTGTATSALIYRPTGTGAIAFAGAGVATTAFLGGSGAITFGGAGVAILSPLTVTGVGHIDFNGRADVDIAPHLDVYAPPEWSWLVLQPDGTPLGSLTMASDRKLTFQLDAAATASFTMPGEHPQTATITELASDLYVARNGRPLFRGRIGGSTETHSAATDSVNLAATDYRGLLDHRLIWSTSQLVFAGVDQSDIAWQLVADTQALGALGVTRGAGTVTGVVRDRTFTAGSSVGQAIKDVGDVADGFDWEIDAHLAFNLYCPQRGRNTGQILTYGRDVVAVTTTVDPAKYANAVYYTGSTPQTTPAEVVDTPPTGVGRWERQSSDVNATLQATVDEEAAGELADSSQLIAAITVTLAADRWNPYLLWLGDTVRVLVNAGRLDLDVTRRIVQIDVTLDDTGVETVTLAIGSAPPKLSDRLNDLQQQITDLQLAPGIGNPNFGGGGGGGGGGIQEITSIDGSIVVTNPTGPITNLTVAGGGLIQVTNPTGPVVDLSVGGFEFVTNVYELVSISANTGEPNQQGFYSFNNPDNADVSWLDFVPASETGWIPNPDTGELVAKILAPGAYYMSILFETISNAMGPDASGDLALRYVQVSLTPPPPFGSAESFLLGYYPSQRFQAAPYPLNITAAALARAGQYAAWELVLTNYGHVTVPGVVKITVTLIRGPLTGPGP